MIRRRTKKRGKEEREYSKQRVAFLSSRPYCQAALSGCTSSSECIHHKKGRIGDLLLDQRYWLAVCTRCHDWIENHPTEAKELGLSESRLSIDNENTGIQL